MNYPEPWLGGRWTPRDVVEHHLLASLGLLEGVANNRVMLKRNFHAHAASGPSSASAAATRGRSSCRPRSAIAAPPIGCCDLLRAGGAEVDVVTGSADGIVAGDAVVRLAQPFGRWVKDLLEPQVYPELEDHARSARTT